MHMGWDVTTLVKLIPKCGTDLMQNFRWRADEVGM